MKGLQEKDGQQLGRVKRELRDLEAEELQRGYLWSEAEKNYRCIFCGEIFEEGVIYPCGPRLLTAEKAAKEHIEQRHGGSFACLLSMDKQVNGLTDVQKKILRCFYEGKETDDICRVMDITPATVRTHRYNLQRMKREAKILLALMEQMEREDRPPLPQELPSWEQEKALEEEREEKDNRTLPGSLPDSFTGNSLHPFFMRNQFE